jgi:hypothetical protein
MIDDSVRILEFLRKKIQSSLQTACEVLFKFHINLFHYFEYRWQYTKNEQVDERESERVCLSESEWMRKYLKEGGYTLSDDFQFHE